jgi:formate dehydrogenase subunit delta
MHDEELIRMANQIADFFKVYPHEEAVAEIANHIAKFWDPRMRRRLIEIDARADNPLAPLTREAVARVTAPAA